MTILPTDIKLLESERMRDTDDGGGRQTSNVIQSGVVGNVFPKVSRLDSVYGRVNLRKIYVAVRTATLDMYGGAHAIITDPPNNDRISCVLFSTKSAFDIRSDARNRIESYVVSGPLSKMRLYGNQVVGQKAILVYQREDEPLPDVGTVLCLSIESGTSVGVTQYVRVTDVTHDLRTFTDTIGDYTRRVITLKIGSALERDFYGSEVTRYSTDSSPTKVRETTVADTSKYYGIQPLAENAVAGDLTLKLSSVYAPLVPSTQRESAISNATIAGAVQVVQAASAGLTIVNMGSVYVGEANKVTLKCPFAITRGSVKVGSYTSTGGVDDGNGKIIPGSSTPNIEGRIDYASGVIELWATSSNVTNLQLEYKPAVAITGAANTRQVDVTLSTRGTIYVQTLSPAPSPGSLIVDYRALGKWYRLRDTGAGKLSGNDAAEGTGTVDYSTGSVVVTLGALPDVGSAVLFSWASSVHYTIPTASDLGSDQYPRMKLQLDHAPIVPGSVSGLIYANGTTYAFSVNAAGVFSGAAATSAIISASNCAIDHGAGVLYIALVSTPFGVSQPVDVSYTWQDGADLYSDTASAQVVSGGQFTVPGTAPFRNNGSMTFGLAGGSTVGGYITSGGAVMVNARKRAYNSTLWFDSQQVGVFNASTGVVTITNGISATTAEFVRTNPAETDPWKFDYQWQLTPSSIQILSASSISVVRDTTSYSPYNVTQSFGFTTAPVVCRIATKGVAQIVPGSVSFTIAGFGIFYDRGDGTVALGYSYYSGVSPVVGTIDYSEGVVELTGIVAPGTVSISMVVNSCLTAYGSWWVPSTSFRLAGSPIRPASFYVEATGLDGRQSFGTANTNGDVSGTLIRGAVNQEMGIANIEFGEDVGGVWVPTKIDPSSIRYNGVVLSNLPLDASVLGLDPVRLPADGRVPIYRAGDVAVVHNTQPTTLPNPVAANGVYSLGRTSLATVRLEDATGTEVPPSEYTADLDTGELTIGAGWTGAGVTEPLVAKHRIEQMVLVTDAQITGNVSISAPLDRDFPDTSSFLSSALLFGDLQAYVTNLFDQTSWTGSWSNTVIGSGASAQYDDVNFPVEVVNQSAVTERWRISFTSSTAFQVIGENLGVIATGTISADCGPTSPVTGDAYFVIRAGGWGAGWSAGNQLRFNTIGANGPTWIARTILAGATLEGDSFDIEARGDVD